MPQPDGPIRAVISLLGDLDVDVADGPERAVEARHVLQLDDGLGSAVASAADARCGGVADRIDGPPSPGRLADGRLRELGVHGVLLYHWMCLDRRARTISARAFRTSISTRITMIAAAAMPWKSSCGRCRPVEDLDRQHGVAARERLRNEGHEADGADRG